MFDVTADQRRSFSRQALESVGEFNIFDSGSDLHRAQFILSAYIAGLRYHDDKLEC